MIISIALIGGYALVYGLVHSWLAADAMKDWARRRWGPAADRWYRLVYNLIGTLLLLPFVPLLLWLPDQALYILPAPWFWLALAGQVACLAGIAYGIWLTDALHFLGLRQLASPAALQPAKQPRLVISGPYRWVRHPLYFFGLLLIWLTPQMTVNRLALGVALSLYLYIGAGFEERRLVREFGAAYRAYQQTTPRLLPLPRLFRRRPTT